jgi:hypothetical protein
MYYHNMWGLGFGTGPRLSGVSDPIGPGLYRIVDMNFGEFFFYEVA